MDSFVDRQVTRLCVAAAVKGYSRDDTLGIARAYADPAAGRCVLQQADKGRYTVLALVPNVGQTVFIIGTTS